MAEMNVGIRVQAATKEAQQALKRLEGAIDDVGDEAKRTSAVMQATATQASRSMTIASGSVANLTAQFNDIGQMLMAGQSPLMLAVQQGTQISQVLGPMGAKGAVQALGQAFLGLLSPVNLVTLGVIAGGASLVQWLMQSREETESLADRMDHLGATLDAIARDAKIAAQPIDDLRKKYGDLADEIQRAAQESARFRIAEALAQVQSVADDLRGKVADASELMMSIAQVQADLERVQADPSSVVAPERTMRTLRDTIADLEADLTDMLGTLGLTRQQVLDLELGFRNLASASSLEEVTSAANFLLLVIDGAYQSVGKIPPEMASIRDALVEVLQKAGLAVTAFDDMAGGAGRAADEAARLARNMAVAGEVYWRSRFSGEEAVMGQELVPTRLSQEQIDAALGRLSTRRRGGSGGGGRSPIVEAREAWERLRASVDQAYAAQLRYRDAQEVVNEALRRGVIDQAQATETLQMVKQSLDDATQAGNAFGDTLEGTILDAVTGVKGLSQAFEDLARYIQRAAFQALLFNEGPFASKGGGSGLLGGLIGGITSALTGGTSAAVHHAGGIVGAATASREVPAWVFAGAPRYHGGGIAGLRSDEVPAILQRGEVVLPRGAPVGRQEVDIRLHTNGLEAEILNEAEVRAQGIAVSIVDHYDRAQLARRISEVNQSPRRRG
ncbi:MAG: hypothetical protein D6811_05140 [Alphaproteobacteria bacterium]|nr:MAG: hypothetical protein D6811_05140 [Alphaproteobacteria bacterium]